MQSTLLSFLFLVLSIIQADALAHGSVTAEEDLCIINIGYFKAHFKIHLPRIRQHEEFCEDLPEAGEAVFVMDYIHGDLGSVAMDFRIIKNVTGLGRFAKLDDVQAIKDIDGATVYYQLPSIERDVFIALHHFDETGEYLGIVTAKNPQTQQVYAAVFPFEVGYTEVGYLPLFLVFAVLVQLTYWLMNGDKMPWRRQDPASYRSFSREQVSK
jgi:hypothetical protein